MIMKKSFGAVLACCALLTAGAAAAATTINTNAFSLSRLDSWGYVPFDMQVLSDSGGITRIAMGGLEPTSWPIHEMDYVEFAMSHLAGDVHQGYRISSITISGVMAGDYSVGQISASCRPSICDGYAGFATNGGSVRMQLTQDGVTSDLPAWSVQDFTGQRAFSHRVETSLAGQFELRTDTNITANAQDAREYYSATPEHDWEWNVRHPSSAWSQMSDVVMTVQVAQVPEPGTYAMLLGGLGLLAAVARRQRG